MQISPSCACLLRKKVYRQAFSNHFTCNQNVFQFFKNFSFVMIIKIIIYFYHPVCQQVHFTK